MEGKVVIQRRYNGSVDFYRNWASYKEGFGSAYGEYWLGNYIIHQLTSNANNDLIIEMTDFEGASKFAEYTSFHVGDDGNKYRLAVDHYSGETDILEKKKQLSTVEAFKQDLEWAIAEKVATKDGEVTVSNPSAELSRQLKVYMDTLTKNNWRDVLKAAKEEMTNVSVSGRKAAAVLDEDDFDVLHLLSTVKQNCPLHLSDRDSIAVIFHLVSDLVVKGVYAIDIDPEEIDQACAESFRKLVEVMKETKAQPGSEEMITENDLVQDNGVERDVVPKQSDKQFIDNVIKDVKIPGSEEMITENDLVQDNGVERDVVPKQSDKQLIDNVIKDVKIPGSEEMITEDDFVQDKGVERVFVPKQSDEQLMNKMIKDAKIPGDNLSWHSGVEFSTYDMDNDKSTGICAVSYKEAWWYNNCHQSNLNGQYLYGHHDSDIMIANRLNWHFTILS